MTADSYRVTLDDSDELDEVVVHGPSLVHLERMDLGAWWLGIDLPDGGRIAVNLCTKRQSVTAVRPTYDVETRSRKVAEPALVLREVLPANRDSTCEPGRALYWRPNASRYTHDPAEAGLYERGSFHSIEHSREVEAEPVLVAELAVVEARRTALLELLERVRRSGA